MLLSKTDRLIGHNERQLIKLNDCLTMMETILGTPSLETISEDRAETIGEDHQWRPSLETISEDRADHHWRPSLETIFLGDDPVRVNISCVSPRTLMYWAARHDMTGQ